MAGKKNGGLIFGTYILSSYPLLWVQTYEEQRAILRIISEMKSCSKEEYSYFSWDCASGLRALAVNEGGYLGTGAPVVVEISGVMVPMLDPQSVFDWANSKQCPNNAILILKDFHEELNRGEKAPIYRRILRDLIHKFKGVGKTVIIISPVIKIPDEIEKEITVIQFSLPSREDLRGVLTSLCEAVKAPYPGTKDGKVVDSTADEPLIDAGLGMTCFEFENALAISLAEKHRFDVGVIAREKAAIVKKTNVAQVIRTDLNIADIGGNERLKEYAEESSQCFTQEARDFGVEPPRGVLLMGPPGCGKSLAAKVLGNVWKRPVLRFDVGSIMSKWQGESEQNLNKVLSLASAIAPCILWIDELEKNFKGAGGETDNGTPSQMLQILLTFMQEREADVVVVATANRVDLLPPELLSRFSQIFWVDLPDDVQRQEILSIHLTKRKQNLEGMPVAQLMKASMQFSGREIENWVRAALKRAFLKKHGKVMLEDLLEMAGTITPAAKLMSEKIKANQTWASDHGAIMAGISHESKEGEPVVKPRRVIQHISGEE